MPEIWQTCKTQMRLGRTPHVRLMYMIRGTVDEWEARVLLATESPIHIEGVLYRQSAQLDHLGAGVWTCSVDYGIGDMQTAFNPIDGGAGTGGGGGGAGGSGSDGGHAPAPTSAIGPHVSLTIGARTMHITQALTSSPAALKKGDQRTPPNHEGAIGVDDNEGIKGCDIIVPDLRWSETWTWDAKFITWEYIAILFRMVGRVNGRPMPGMARPDYNGNFRNFDKGEVMFLGAEIDEKGDGQAQAVYHFHAEPNNYAFQLSDKWDPVFKGGHEYIWFEYERDKDRHNRLILPWAVHVEEVGRERETGTDPGKHPDADGYLNRVDFLFLGIGR